jgi:hypothetical protein
MAVQAQQLPVAAVFGIEIMVVIAMVYCQLVQVFAVELATAAATYMRIHLQCPFAIAFVAVIAGTMRARHQAV